MATFCKHLVNFAKFGQGKKVVPIVLANSELVSALNATSHMSKFAGLLPPKISLNPAAKKVPHKAEYVKPHLCAIK